MQSRTRGVVQGGKEAEGRPRGVRAGALAGRVGCRSAVSRSDWGGTGCTRGADGFSLQQRRWRTLPPCRGGAAEDTSVAYVLAGPAGSVGDYSTAAEVAGGRWRWWHSDRCPLPRAEPVLR